MKAKLTVRSVEAVQPAASDTILWDTEVTGFGCKVTPRGKRSYFLYYRTKENQQRRPTIGAHGPLKPESAREIAKRWLVEVAQGQDPSETRKTDRQSPTVRKLCQRYLDEHAETRKKVSSIRHDRRLIDVHLLPAIGAKKVGVITRNDIAALHHSLRRTPYEANRMLALASKMFSLAERWGLRPDGSNPAKNIDRYREKKRERYLSEAEVARLWTVLHSEAAQSTASPNAITAIKLLLVTGRRLSEILSLEWSFINFDSGVMGLPDTKAGALIIPLGEAGLSIFAELRFSIDAARDETERLKKEWKEPRFVFPSRGVSGRLINLQKPWNAIRAIADLNDVRLHDLRHTYASVGAGLGMSLPLIGRLLGHSQAATTSRYAHLASDPVRLAADAINDKMMIFAKATKVVPAPHIAED